MHLEILFRLQRKKCHKIQRRKGNREESRYVVCESFSKVNEEELGISGTKKKHRADKLYRNANTVDIMKAQRASSSHEIRTDICNYLMMSRTKAVTLSFLNNFIIFSFQIKDSLLDRSKPEGV